ncbi:hypothetical protein TSMEX_002964 [Taenia solium]|eukprot:TsM_000762400 transcript=TsM_000762400 gene=TsM_000762400
MSALLCLTLGGRRSDSEMGEIVAPFGNFFRALRLKTRLELADEEWVYTEEPHVERRRISVSPPPAPTTLIHSARDGTHVDLELDTLVY